MRFLNIYWHQRLGRGGEAAVYLGQFTDGEYCAIKAPPLSLQGLLSIPAFYAAVRQQLQKEFVRHQRMRGDRHVRLLGADFNGPIPFIALEYAPNGTLRDEMDSHFSEGYVYHPVTALRRTLDLLHALHEAHHSGILHRDVKPDNLLMFGETVKLSDFGIGRTLLRRDNRYTHAFIGTPLYAAPEQLRAPAYIDVRADLYSVGVVLYEMLMGDVPPLRRRIFTRPSARFGNITARLENFLASLLAEERTQRPRSAYHAYRQAEVVLNEYLLMEQLGLAA